MRRAVFLSLVLAGCTAAAPAPGPARGYTPDAAGLAVDGTAQRVDFGRAEAGAIAAVSRLEGRAPRATLACPGGTARAVQWDGLTLYFRGGAFLGWSRPDGSGAGISCA